MHFWLFVHVLGAVLLVGNIVTAAFWKLRADWQGQPVVIHSAAKNVMMADAVFTLPGIFMIIVSGSLMAEKAGYSLSGWNWLTLSLFLFTVTGIIWAAVLLPLQRSMIRHSRLALESGTISAAYRRASAAWAVFGTAATLLPVAVLYLMIAKGF